MVLLLFLLLLLLLLSCFGEIFVIKMNCSVRFHKNIPLDLRMSYSHEMKLHGPSMFAVKAKIYGVLYKQSS